MDDVWARAQVDGDSEQRREVRGGRECAAAKILFACKCERRGREVRASWQRWQLSHQAEWQRLRV